MNTFSVITIKKTHLTIVTMTMMPLNGNNNDYHTIVEPHTTTHHDSGYHLTTTLVTMKNHSTGKLKHIFQQLDTSGWFPLTMIPVRP